MSAKHRSDEHLREELHRARQRAMAAFARADTGFIAEAWERLGSGRAVSTVRGPEVGLVMVRGRAGGGGAPFNLGEASVTRASVRIEDHAGAVIGHAMILGRDLKKARLAASFDALWQVADERERIQAEVVAAIEATLAERDARHAEETAATRVDFFTMVRGED
ncbi:phosphonate C-P lyase system protein PhnG [Fulvimarina sp. 2208YS6-2-32]|uniref:Phosphonate C-P lyase system protein PhnG n=1 Tax=Fulvimarina uroteuthidis TaxID=3098149 RepID=A0ABU5I3D8_9HYPH|nr:phosphonate C-P lyase system protein PhnG [Fulvimarina sp. 2208YS6-2-32]MDY8109892.1 phosphonate C-P lyase system protein PhnG [Fulvimarina sp. 2208YS6-2-32]